MRHRKKGKTLDRKKAPKELMLRNMAASLIIYEKVETTLAKAKVLQPIVEKLITSSKGKTLPARRNAAAVLPVKNAQKKLFEVLADKYADQKGGYTRIVKTGERQGDGAQMARVELI